MLHIRLSALSFTPEPKLWCVTAVLVYWGDTGLMYLSPQDHCSCVRD